MSISFTKHAKVRRQQRAVPRLVVNWLLQFGSVEHDKHGAEIHFFNKESRKALASEVGSQIVSRVADLLDAYLVINGNQVVTVGYRFKHINRT